MADKKAKKRKGKERGKGEKNARSAIIITGWGRTRGGREDTASRRRRRRLRRAAA